MLNTLDMLEELTQATGVVADEGSAWEVAAKLAQPYGTVRRDALGNVLVTVREPKEGQPHILLDAHLDEIGMAVSEIDDEGFLHVIPNGGVDKRLLLAQEVTVHGTKPLYGIVVALAPHLMTEEDKKAVPEFDKITIDLGMSKEEVEKYVMLGDKITVNGKFTRLLNNRAASKAMDDRAGIVSLLEAAQLLQGEDLSCGVTLLFSTQEEIGGYGAQVATFGVEPTHAIAVDVSFARTPDTPKNKTFPLGCGTLITASPAMSKRVFEDLKTAAKEENIPYMVEVTGANTGTNANSIFDVKTGVLTGVLGIPLRYMHTPVEVIDPHDIECTAKLLAAYIRRLGK